MDINGKTVIVTGSASGIGFSMSSYFASKGATVVITDVAEDAIGKSVDEIKSNGGNAIGVPCNVVAEKDVENLVAETLKETGRLDVAVLNAGILRDGLLIKVDRETGKVVKKMALGQWQSVIDVNLTGVFLSGREMAAAMVDAGNGGVIIPVSSIARHGNMGQSNYSAAKAGVAGMTITWSKELARHKIRVAGIAPGFIETPMVMKDMKPEALEKWKKTIPLGRLGKPEEIAHTAQYIIENDLVTGIVIDVSAGIRI